MPRQFVSNKDVTIRLFENDVMEFLSKVHPSVPLLVFLPIVGGFLFYSAAASGYAWADIVMWCVFGLVIWTFAEYGLHRFMFHFKPVGPRTERIHFLAHGVHHDYPMDSKRLVMPPLISVPLASVFYLLFRILFGQHASPITAGFLTGYMIYDMTHYAIHHFNMHSSYWLAVKNHHMRHHFQDSDKGFGVSLPFWDRVFGTDFPAKGSVKVKPAESHDQGLQDQSPNALSN